MARQKPEFTPGSLTTRKGNAKKKLTERKSSIRGLSGYSPGMKGGAETKTRGGQLRKLWRRVAGGKELWTSDGPTSVDRGLRANIPRGDACHVEAGKWIEWFTQR